MSLENYRLSAPTRCISWLPCAFKRVKMWPHSSGSSAHLLIRDSWFLPLSVAWPYAGSRSWVLSTRTLTPRPLICWSLSEKGKVQSCSDKPSSWWMHTFFHSSSKKDKESEDTVKFLFGTSVILRETYQLSQPWLLSLQHLPKPPTSLEILFWENCLKTKITQITKTNKKRPVP